MKEVILFCQAPKDVQYCLTIYEQQNKKCDISIFVINIEGIYKFFIELNLDLKQLVFIPINDIFTDRNPLIIVKEFIRVKRIKRKYFHDRLNCNVYFFYTVFDWVTAALVTYLSKKNKVTFVGIDNPADQSFSRSFSAYSISCVILLYFITGIKFHFLKHNFGNILNFNYFDYPIVRNNNCFNFNDSVFKKYCYKPKVTKPSIFLFENKQDEYDFYKNYESTLKIILDIFCEKFNVLIKPHPRQGYTEIIDDYTNVEFISTYIPGEFLDLSEMKYIFGIDTTALAAFSKENPSKVFCLLTLFEFNDINKKNYQINHLNLLSENKIKYIKDLDTLKKIINEDFKKNF